MLLITTLTFVLIHVAPGDPMSSALEGPGVTTAVREQWRASFGLDRPLPEQYVRWVANAVRGELGYSFSHHRPVRDVLVGRRMQFRNGSRGRIAKIITEGSAGGYTAGPEPVVEVALDLCGTAFVPWKTALARMV